MKIFVAVWALVGLLLTGTVATAQPAKPTIVLVHGAFANSSSWYGVITILERGGYSVVAAANPLRSVKGDADTVRALLATINTPVVLVGHSYGGMVISNAANGQANVKALVYVAPFAPDAGENHGDLNSKFPGSLVGPALAPPVPLPGGCHDLYVQQEKFHDAFAPDVPADAARPRRRRRGPSRTSRSVNLQPSGLEDHPVMVRIRRSGHRNSTAVACLHGRARPPAGDVALSRELHMS